MITDDWILVGLFVPFLSCCICAVACKDKGGAVLGLIMTGFVLLGMTAEIFTAEGGWKDYYIKDLTNEQKCDLDTLNSSSKWITSAEVDINRNNCLNGYIITVGYRSHDESEAKRDAGEWFNEHGIEVYKIK